MFFGPAVGVGRISSAVGSVDGWQFSFQASMNLVMLLPGAATFVDRQHARLLRYPAGGGATRRRPGPWRQVEVAGEPDRLEVSTTFVHDRNFGVKCIRDAGVVGQPSLDGGVFTVHGRHRCAPTVHF